MVQAGIVGWQINFSGERDRERETLAAPLTPYTKLTVLNSVVGIRNLFLLWRRWGGAPDEAALGGSWFF